MPDRAPPLPCDPAPRACRARRLGLRVALGLMTAACGDTMDRDELARRIEAGEAPAVVDVRSRGEYARAHVPGAVHLPFHAILARAEEIPPPRSPDEPVVLYCEHGPRAVLAAIQLRLVGQRPVALLEGHMAGWRRDERPLATDEAPPSP